MRTWNIIAVIIGTIFSVVAIGMPLVVLVKQP